MTAKKSAKKRDVQSCCFGNLSLVLFAVLVAVAVVVTYVPYFREFFLFNDFEWHPKDDDEDTDAVDYDNSFY